MSYRVRVQLQQGRGSDNSKTDSSNTPLTADETITLLKDLLAESRNLYNDDTWESELSQAINKSISWVNGFRGHGCSFRGDGDQNSETFIYKGDKWRVDVGTFGGSGDGDWFK
jgi:hypothetical protein